MALSREGERISEAHPSCLRIYRSTIPRFFVLKEEKKDVEEELSGKTPGKRRRGTSGVGGRVDQLVTFRRRRRRCRRRRHSGEKQGSARGLRPLSSYSADTGADSHRRASRAVKIYLLNGYFPHPGPPFFPR